MSDSIQVITHKSRNADIRFDSYRVFSQFLHSKVKATKKKKCDDDDIVVRPHVASDGINSEVSLQSQDSNASTLEFGSNKSFAEETSGNVDPPATSHHVNEVGSSAMAVAAQDSASSEPPSFQPRTISTHISSDQSVRNKKFADDIFGVLQQHSKICLKNGKKQRDSLLDAEKPSPVDNIFAQRPAAVSSTAASSQSVLSTQVLRDQSYIVNNELSEDEKSRRQPGTFRPPLLRGHPELPADFPSSHETPSPLDAVEIALALLEDKFSDLHDRHQLLEASHNRADFWHNKLATQVTSETSEMRADMSTMFAQIREQFLKTPTLDMFKELSHDAMRIEDFLQIIPELQQNIAENVMAYVLANLDNARDAVAAGDFAKRIDFEEIKHLHAKQIGTLISYYDNVKSSLGRLPALQKDNAELKEELKLLREDFSHLLASFKTHANACPASASAPASATSTASTSTPMSASAPAYTPAAPATSSTASAASVSGAPSPPNPPSIVKGVLNPNRKGNGGGGPPDGGNSGNSGGSGLPGGPPNDDPPDIDGVQDNFPGLATTKAGAFIKACEHWEKENKFQFAWLVSKNYMSIIIWIRRLRSFLSTWHNLSPKWSMVMEGAACRHLGDILVREGIVNHGHVGFSTLDLDTLSYDYERQASHQHVLHAIKFHCTFLSGEEFLRKLKTTMVFTHQALTALREGDIHDNIDGLYTAMKDYLHDIKEFTILTTQQSGNWPMFPVTNAKYGKMSYEGVILEHCFPSTLMEPVYAFLRSFDANQTSARDLLGPSYDTDFDYRDYRSAEFAKYLTFLGDLFSLAGRTHKQRRAELAPFQDISKSSLSSRESKLNYLDAEDQTLDEDAYQHALYNLNSRRMSHAPYRAPQGPPQQFQQRRQQPPVSGGGGAYQTARTNFVPNPDIAQQVPGAPRTSKWAAPQAAPPRSGPRGICKQMLRFGSCTYGDKCIYDHNSARITAARHSLFQLECDHGLDVDFLDDINASAPDGDPFSLSPSGLDTPGIEGTKAE